MLRKALRGEVDAISDKTIAMIACASNDHLYAKLTPSLKRDQDIMFLVLINGNIHLKPLENLLENIVFDDASLTLLEQLSYALDDVFHDHKHRKEEFKQYVPVLYSIVTKYKNVNEYMYDNLPPMLRGQVLWYKEYHENKLHTKIEFTDVVALMLDQSPDILWKISSIHYIQLKDVFFNYEKID